MYERFFGRATFSVQPTRDGRGYKTAVEVNGANYIFRPPLKSIFQDGENLKQNVWSRSDVCKDKGMIHFANNIGEKRYRQEVKEKKRKGR